MRDFRKYDVWSDGIDLANAIYNLASQFPPDERFGLSSQMRRAAVSMPSNIAEGASRKPNLEFSRFIEMAIGSSFDSETQLMIALKRKYLSEQDSASLLGSLHSLQRRLNAFRTTLFQTPG